MTTLPNLLEARAGAAPDAVALWHKRRGIWHARSWAAYLGEVRRCAAVLRAAGFGPGARLILLGEATPEFLVADLAAQWLGGASVVPYPDGPLAELAAALAQAPSGFAVVDGPGQEARLAAALGAAPRWCVQAPALLALAGNAPAHDGPPADAALATIAFTAGAACRAVRRWRMPGRS